jgi:hypothetical protein
LQAGSLVSRSYFSNNRRFFQHWFIEAPAAVCVRTAQMRQGRDFFFRVSLHQTKAVRAGILSHCHTDGFDARVEAQVLERDCRGGELSQVRGAMDAGPGGIGGGSITFRAGLHGGFSWNFSLFYHPAAGK